MKNGIRTKVNITNKKAYQSNGWGVWARVPDSDGTLLRKALTLYADGAEAHEK